MGGMKISELDFLCLLPAFMRDDEAAIALSKAMNQLLGEPGKRLKTPRIWDQIENLNETECDELAWELDIDWYNTGMPLKEKQFSLKSAQQVKRKRGTQWAVENLITIAFGEGKVIPWFKYGGNPYCFKVRTNGPLTKDGMAYFLYMIKKVKSVRDNIEMIEIMRTIKQTMHAGTAQLSYTKCVVFDYFHELRCTHCDQHVGIALVYNIKNIIREG